ncbi:ELMO domain-containing protein 1-like [Hydractinia symbiolongicarpus]|uniref:ELMO domain-containing protein 1-like n=1 Tax=Hydractinia symbiolongicarpus TaxID=13093 RepID=UPI002551BC08|nr:ELMO domain-containing protein 1-like [Hydractinia symbiolongicarpus]
MDFIVGILHSISKYRTTTRSIVKQIIRMITGKCELERLCQSNKFDFRECQEVEFSLYHSKQEEIRRILVADKMKVKNALQTILRLKRIVPDKDLEFLSAMPKFLCKIISYNALLTKVDQERSQKYDEENESHEELLHQLWLFLKGDEKLPERYTSKWTEIGFQGKNPATDFRGMGILGLKNLIFLLEKSPETGMKIFGQSKHPKYGFSFAIMGINFTGTAFELLRSGKLKGYMYNLKDDEYKINHFQRFFVDIFSEFSDYWVLRQPPNIMSFNEIKEDYMKEVNKRLVNGSW